MNRYRTIPGFTGQSKASPSTTCQKCLKKGHYSFECKESVQTRPYVSRPSRTQQLLNPSLAPRLASDTNNDLLRKKGVADEQLVQAEAKRAKSNSQRSVSPEAHDSPGRKRPRSTSSSSGDSISTISTNRSRSKPPKHGNFSAESDQATSQQVPRFSRSLSRSLSRSPPRKRKHDRLSSESISRSPSRSRSRDRKSRRHRKSSPDDRGRSNAYRRGSHRSRSRTRSLSMDKSRVAKQRRSLDDSRKDNGEDERMYRSRDVKSSHRRDDSRSRRSNGNAAYHSGPPPRPRERSLSPYSRRLALTQSMNMTR